MVKCDQARDLCHARCDGEITADEALELDRHLLACPECRELADAMTELSASLAGLRDATRDIGQGAGESSPPAPLSAGRPLRRSAWWRVGRLAAAVAVVLGAMLYWDSRPEKPRDAWSGNRGVAPSSDPGHSEPGTGVMAEIEAEPRSSARVTLASRSAEAFIPVERETGQSKVHVFVLFQRVPSLLSN